MMRVPNNPIAMLGITILTFAIAAVRCALLGAVCGAIFGAIAGLPFAPPAGPILGLIFGTVAGFIAGLAGGSFAGSPGFRVGGLVGSGVCVALFPAVLVFWFAPPLLVVLVALVFGGFLDNQVESDSPASYLGEAVTRIVGRTRNYPRGTRTACGFSVAAIVTLGGFILGWEMIRLGWPT